MTTPLDRRQFVQSVAATATGLTLGTSIFAADKNINMKTYTYKTVGKLQIKADVYRPADDKTRPVALWIHGGALIMGNRAGISRRVREALLDDGYAVVSIDYRLAPETKIDGIISDIEDACTWIREQGPKLFNIDPKRLAVLGGSAGGYLTLTSGFRAKPRPTVLVSFWGYGDLVGDWYSKPSTFYRKRPLVSEEAAWAGVSGPALTDGAIKRNQRRDFYLYCRQQGVWPKLVSTFDPHKQPEKFKAFEPVRNVTKDYPPTLLIHGTVDTDVPYEQSVLMAEQFKQHNVDHEFATVKGAGHGLSRGDRKLVDAAYAKVMPFVNRYMKP